MTTIAQARTLLEEQIAVAEQHLFQLKQQLAELESCATPSAAAPLLHPSLDPAHDRETQVSDTPQEKPVSNWPLLQDEYRRYGRQMIVDQIGLTGQLSLRNAKVLIVGAGGLGCPAAMYLAGAGVGTLGIIDGDTVEASNLHRQILHRTKYVGQFKVDSAIKYLQELNPHPTYIPYRKRLTPQEAPDIFDKYEIILDCTDNPATRYLISDTAVLLGKPVVSASALRTEGQLMILNYPPKPRGNTSGGSCYRCVFPKPPPPDSVVSCADGGIIGPVVGLMGVMQALETIKIITSQSTTDVGEQTIVPSLHLFSAYSTPPFRNVRLRKRRANCSVCSATATITLETLRNASTDYVQFCGLSKTPSLLDAHERITPVEYRETYSKVSRDQASEIPVLIDVREKVQYEICALPNSINIPVSHILSSLQTTDAQNLGDGDGNSPPWLPASVLDSGSPLYVLCRQGNDSQVVVKKLKNMGIDRNGKRIITDIRGGLVAWRNDIDPDFPDY